MDVTQSTAGDVIEVRPMTIHIGAELFGVDLAGSLTDEQVAAIRRALLRWKVVFFRDQALDHEAHVRLARHFGAPTPAHIVFGTNESHPEVYSIAKHRTAQNGRTSATRCWSGWHTDITAAINPPWASILRGVTVPPYGGDTQWTNLALAFARLSTPMQRFVEGLRAVHRFDAPAGDGDYARRVGARDLAAEHPLVTMHPETGEKVLYVSPGFVKEIVGLEPSESRALLENLWEHAVSTEFTVRFRWAPGSVAFWDNRATAHLAPVDIFATDFERQFYRVTLNGEVPVGVDGRPSTLLSGEPIEAQPA
jgi:alpha-ketoglutarate-dependent sulfate ester dioxygenase